jgi:hypothetical protein
MKPALPWAAFQLKHPHLLAVGHQMIYLAFSKPNTERL